MHTSLYLLTIVNHYLTLDYLKSRTLVTEFPKPCYRFSIEVNDLRTLCSDSALQAWITVHEIKRLSFGGILGDRLLFYPRSLSR